MNPSLRSRIFLWYAITLPVLILALAFLAQRVMIEGLSDALDDRLSQRAATVGAAILASGASDTSDYEELLDWLTEQRLPYVPAFVQVSDSNLQVLARFGEIPGTLRDEVAELLLTPERAEGYFETVHVREHGALRIYTVAVESRSGGDTVVFVQTGDSLAQLDLARSQLWRQALLLGVGGSVVALLAGWAILRRGLWPLDHIVSQVREIRGMDLAIRLEEESRPAEIQELADGLNSMLERLDEAFRAREAFVAGVSHDLRTPLSILQGQVDVLLMDPTTSPGARDSLQRMRREIRRLAGMTYNLLLNAQLDYGLQPVILPVNLSQLVEEVARETRILGPLLDVHEEVQEGLSINGDYDLLKQMLLNIVDNSCKFTPAGGTLSINARQEGDFVVFNVSDTGRGIPPGDLPRVTEPFYKVEESTGGRRGVGLGLTLVRQIVELHNGTLDISSREDVSTTVIVYIPVT